MAIKQIAVDRLKPGMYVHDLNLDWSSHPFLRSRFAVGSDRDVEKIRDAGVHLLYIDTAKGLDDVEARTEAEVAKGLHEELIAVASASAEHAAAEVADLRPERERAKEVHQAANQVVRGLMRDARLGRQVQVEAVEPIVEQMTASILRDDGAMLSLCRLKSADDYTFLHCVAVGALMISFSRYLGHDAAFVRQCGLGGMLHDIGKAKTPLHILNKPGKLDDLEFARIKSHPTDGHAMLVQAGGMSPEVLTICRHHHERLDGSGYPDKQAGSAIAYEAQIGALCDVYDALTSDRVYHRGMAPTEALRKLLEWSPHHFDPKLVRAFTRCVGIYPVGAMVRLESGRIAVVETIDRDKLLTPVVRVVWDTRRNAPIEPFRLDLAAPEGHGGADRIVLHEDPMGWLMLDDGRVAPRRGARVG